MWGGRKSIRISMFSFVSCFSFDGEPQTTYDEISFPSGPASEENCDFLESSKAMARIIKI